MTTKHETDPVTLLLKGERLPLPDQPQQRVQMRQEISTAFRDGLKALAKATGRPITTIAHEAVRIAETMGRTGSPTWARNSIHAGRLTDAVETAALAQALGVPLDAIDAHLRLAPWVMGETSAKQVETPPKPTEIAEEAPPQPDDLDRTGPVADDDTADAQDRPADAGDHAVPLATALIAQAKRPRDLKQMAKALEEVADELRAEAHRMKKARRAQRRTDACE